MKYVLVTEDNCLNSLMALNWTKRNDSVEVEKVDIHETPDIAMIYGVIRIPTLLKIGQHGLIDRVSGYNEVLYNNILEEI